MAEAKTAAKKAKPAAAKKPAATAKAAKPGKPPLKAVKHQEFTIKTKRSGRYWVIGKNGKTVNGADKTKVLVGAKLLKESAPKAKEESSEATNA